MKIDRLYTLSQFIDELTLDFNESQSWMAEAYLTIHRYNDFLKQPLKKEMFVCEVEKPESISDIASDYSRMNYANSLFEYEEAQKKVIFDGWSQSICMKYEIIKGTDIVDFSNCDFPKLSQRNSQIVSVKTLHDLAEATNGELKLKNIEL